MSSLVAPCLAVLVAVPVTWWVHSGATPAAPEASDSADRLAALLDEVTRENERSLALAARANEHAVSSQAVPAARRAVDDSAIAEAVTRWLESNGLGPADLVVAPAQPAGIDSLEDLEVKAIVQLFLKDGDTLDAQLMFQELRDAGRIDEFLAWVQGMVEDDPENPELQVALGVTYLQKLFGAGATPEAGNLAFAADAAFDRALELDPENWDARFTKAVALSNWPAFLGKAPEAISHFETLLAQQKQSTPNPQYAQTYLYLGNMYVQTGERDKALEVWRDGLARYPQDADLLEQLRLAGE